MIGLQSYNLKFVYDQEHARVRKTEMLERDLKRKEKEYWSLEEGFKF